MPTRFRSLSPFAVLAFLCTLGGSPVLAELLGQISFPNSGAEAAQEDFLEGVLYLHNFEYEDAADAFRRAQTTDPGFAMAYWGEAMTHNHPIWMRQEASAGIEALKGLAETSDERRAMAGSDREAAYLAAIEVLYGIDSPVRDMTKEERDDRYRQAMRRLHETYPDDDEATAFYALSILGTAHEGRDFAVYMQAAAVADTVWGRNDHHPGAAHYLIHSFDDPIHAPLGLPMARRYAKIAPAAAHAQHMTSHIFVALGLWQDVVDANVVASRVQNAGFANRGQPPRTCGHYPYWLQYGYLQQGKLGEARRVLDECRTSVTPVSDEGVRWHYVAMRARYLIDADAWDEIGELGVESGTDVEGFAEYVFANGLAAQYRGIPVGVEGALKALADIESGRGAEGAEILALELDGISLLAADPEAAIAKLTEAAEAESSLPYSFGPPSIVKPSFELLGDALLEINRYDEAMEAYRTQLKRTPGRTASYLGLARAAKDSEDADSAREAYSRLAAIWKHAGDETPGVAEAREAANQAP